MTLKYDVNRNSRYFALFHRIR